MLSGDLGDTAVLALTGTPAELDAVGLVVGRPVQPMLASTAASVGAALEVTGEASVEYKLDGARIQVHRTGDDVRIYTRTLAEVTHRLPEVVEVVRGLGVRDVILDGETLALDEDGGPRPSRKPCPGSGRTLHARRCCIRGSSTCCTLTGGTCWTNRCPHASACLKASCPGTNSRGDHGGPGRCRRGVARCTRRRPSRAWW